MRRQENETRVFIYRYNPDVDDAPRMQVHPGSGRRSRHDAAGCAYPAERERSSLSFRRSCREGVCGSDGLNMNGKKVWPVLPRFRHSTSRARRL
ncbi:2Fe-2S iron-sulfur cluster-binding protein [Shigella flexneri]